MITVFYANLVYGQYKGWREIHTSYLPDEITMGGIAYDNRFGQQNWTDMYQHLIDDADVPPELKAWVLIMDL